ncbi:MAG: hypothetical protein KAS32_02795, partial [Candidatus Peribacteraceae bacterium]|nr:hypothetical protein [Candidatus Peribacteraceae bacterium]
MQSLDEFSVNLLSCDDFDRSMPALTPLIDFGLAKQRTQYFTKEQLISDIEKDLKQMWVVFNHKTLSPTGIVVTQIVDYGGRRTLTIPLLAGYGVKKWIQLVYRVESWGLDEKCVFFEVTARNGWVKYLRFL